MFYTYYRIIVRFALTLISATWFAACGYKSNLYLPPPRPASDVPPIVAPLSFHAAPGLEVSTAYPEYPPFTQQP